MCSGLTFWKPYIEHAVGGELDLIVLIGGADERVKVTKILLGEGGV
jgi:hypothetical protein